MRKIEPRERLRVRKRRSRARQRQQELIAEHDGTFSLELQALYMSRDLPSTVWIPLSEFVSRYSPEFRNVLAKHIFIETEKSVAMIGGAVVDLIRPKFLPGEMENKNGH